MESMDLTDQLATLPGFRVYRPAYAAPVRRDFADYLQAKGCALRPAYAALCLVSFLAERGGRPAACSADIRALFPKMEEGLAGRLRNPSDILRRAADRELLEPLGGGWYRLTELGREVVDALPDASRVAELRGCRTVSCGVSRRIRSADDY